jgi:hypothetical protein
MTGEKEPCNIVVQYIQKEKGPTFYSVYTEEIAEIYRYI